MYLNTYREPNPCHVYGMFKHILINHYAIELSLRNNKEAYCRCQESLLASSRFDLYNLQSSE